MDNVYHLNRDQEFLHEFHESFANNMEDVERILILLESEGKTDSQYEKLYEEYVGIVDSIKNRAFAIDIKPFIDIFTKIEQILDRFERERIKLLGRICEPLLMIMDRIHFMADDAATYCYVRNDSIKMIQDALMPYLRVEIHTIDECISEALEVLTGTSKKVEPEKLQVKKIVPNTPPVDQAPPTVPTPNISENASASKSAKRKLVQLVKDEDKLEDDLFFFKGLADEVDLIHKEWNGRTEFIMPIALGMNALAGNVVDFYQLQAAVYIHDVGMRFLPDELLEEKGSFTPEQRQQLLEHPSWAINNFNLMDGWSDAAWIVYQHHEKFDGTGYPEKTKGNEICDGSQILAICDAFFSIINRTKNRSVLRAISEVNACKGGHFAPEWVDIFNNVVRIQQQSGQIK